MVRVIQSMAEYVDCLNALEDSRTDTIALLSFLSSHLVEKNALIRFFSTDSEVSDADKISDSLWERSRKIRVNLRHAPYFEIYNRHYMEELSRTGIVHEHIQSFRLTPKEIIGTFNGLIKKLKDNSNYNVGLCQEVPAFDFIVKQGRGLVLDVRKNYSYQKIQGIMIDENHVETEFCDEFWRLWHAEHTITDKAEVVNFLERHLRNV